MIGTIFLLAALGTAMYLVAKITFNWLRNKIMEKLAKKNVKKVWAKGVERLVEECENVMSAEDLKTLKNAVKGQDMMVLSVDKNGQLDDVELIEDENAILDEEVADWLTSKREILVTN